MGIILNRGSGNNRGKTARARQAPLRPCLLAALIVSCAAPAIHALEEDMVPAGVLRWEVNSRTDHHDLGFNRQNTKGTLLTYLEPDPAVRSQLSGTVTRDYRQTLLRFGFGITDTWNMTLEASRGQAAQTSTVQALSAEPAAQNALTRLGSREISGAGDASLWSLHRTVYSDYHGFVLGWGLNYPLSRVQGPWLGQTTLGIASPTPALQGVLHYTYFPASTPGRFEYRMQARSNLSRPVTLSDGKEKKLRPGNQINLDTGWRQELGPAQAGLLLRLRFDSPSTLSGISQRDSRKELAARLELGAGNLRALEHGPVAFPFHFQIWADHTWRGFNTPVRNELGASFTSYF